LAKVEPIENHGIVGDLNTIALVALDGTVDFFCFPRFDSPSVFACLLDPERGGHFKIIPEFDGLKFKQLYLPDSNILLTRLVSEQGLAEISDFMPVEEAMNAHNLVRRVKSVRGDITFRMAVKSTGMTSSSFPRDRTTPFCGSTHLSRSLWRMGMRLPSSDCAPMNQPPSFSRMGSNSGVAMRMTSSRRVSSARSTTGAVGRATASIVGGGRRWSGVRRSL
jgi:hypothetical protein